MGDEKYSNCHEPSNERREVEGIPVSASALVRQLCNGECAARRCQPVTSGVCQNAKALT